MRRSIGGLFLNIFRSLSTLLLRLLDRFQLHLERDHSFFCDSTPFFSFPFARVRLAEALVSSVSTTLACNCIASSARPETHWYLKTNAAQQNFSQSCSARNSAYVTVYASPKLFSIPQTTCGLYSFRRSRPSTIRLPTVADGSYTMTPYIIVLAKNTFPHRQLL